MNKGFFVLLTYESFFETFPYQFYLFLFIFCVIRLCLERSSEAQFVVQLQLVLDRFLWNVPLCDLELSFQGLSNLYCLQNGMLRVSESSCLSQTLECVLVQLLDDILHLLCVLGGGIHHVSFVSELLRIWVTCIPHEDERETWDLKEGVL